MYTSFEKFLKSRDNFNIPILINGGILFIAVQRFNEGTTFDVSSQLDASLFSNYPDADRFYFISEQLGIILEQSNFYIFWQKIFLEGCERVFENIGEIAETPSAQALFQLNKRRLGACVGDYFHTFVLIRINRSDKPLNWQYGVTTRLRAENDQGAKILRHSVEILGGNFAKKAKARVLHVNVKPLAFSEKFNRNAEQGIFSKKIKKGSKF